MHAFVVLGLVIFHTRPTGVDKGGSPHPMAGQKRIYLHFFYKISLKILMLLQSPVHLMTHSN